MLHGCQREHRWGRDDEEDDDDLSPSERVRLASMLFFRLATFYAQAEGLS